MHLAVLDAGIENLTLIAMDAPGELEETLSVMRGRFESAADISLRSPGDAVMIPENLSSEMIGKVFFIDTSGPCSRTGSPGSAEPPVIRSSTLTDPSAGSSSIFWDGIPGSYFTPVVPDGLESRVRRVGELVEEAG